MANDNNSGALWLHRKIRDHEFWREPRKFSKAEAWLDIIMEVRWQKEDEKVVIGNQIITCSYGQSLNSILTWAKRWRWSEPVTRRFLTLLEKQGMIERRSGAKTTLLTVCNYGKYQNLRRSDDVEMTLTRRRGDVEATTEEEVKEVKKKKSNGSCNPCALPSWLDSDTWELFKENRKKIKAPMTEAAEKIMIKKLEGFMRKGLDTKSILETSIMHGWKGVFEPDQPKTKPKRDPMADFPI